MNEPSTSRRHALHTIRTLMEFWGITPDDLARAGPAPAAADPRPDPALVKYRHPRTGDTWDGRGSQPEWLRLALTREGYTVAELREAALAHLASASA